MGIKAYTVDFATFNSRDSLRLWIPFVLPKSKYKYDKLINFISFCESGSRPKGGIKNEDEGEAISLGAEQIGSDGSLNLSKIPYVSFDFYNNAKKGKVKDVDILICKDGALTGKTCLVDFSEFSSKEVMVNEHVYILRGNEGINQKFLFYLTTTDVFQSQIKDLAYKKKAQPGLNTDHFSLIKIPSIPRTKQDEIIDQIKPFEKEIKKTKNLIRQPQEITDKIFSKEFDFNLEDVASVERVRFFSINIAQTLTLRNAKLRSSVRWAKIVPIQKVLYKNNQYIEKLGKYIISTKNGWSPNCRESDSDYYVFGVNSISKDGYIKFDDLKYSNDNKTNISEYFAQEDGLFVSRGNTVDLVALASVVKNLPRDKDYIFPDLFIRLEIDPDQLDKEYLAHLFNSSVGRLYFKYASKGKNQTMVKISSDELNNFYLPVPPLELQRKIVRDIKKELRKQNELKKKIEKERNKIDEIIEKTIKNS
jgi:type I restriction enzyme S subunit